MLFEELPVVEDIVECAPLVVHVRFAPHLVGAVHLAVPSEQAVGDRVNLRVAVHKGFELTGRQEDQSGPDTVIVVF